MLIWNSAELRSLDFVGDSVTLRGFESSPLHSGTARDVSNKTDEHMHTDATPHSQRVERFLLLLFVPSSVRGFPGESGLGRRLWPRRLAVTVGGRGAIAPPLSMVEGQPRLGLYVAHLLDQTEAADIQNAEADGLR